MLSALEALDRFLAGLLRLCLWLHVAWMLLLLLLLLLPTMALARILEVP